MEILKKQSGQTSLGIIYGLLIAAVIGLGFSIYSDLHRAPPSRLQEMLDSDFRLLKKYHKLPLQLNSLRRVHIRTQDNSLYQTISHIQLPTTTSLKGQFELDVFVFAWQSDDHKKTGYIFQYDLVDPKTKNTIWELSRTYALNAPGQKKSSLGLTK